MSNFLTTLKAHMEACESAPSSGHEHMAFWLADHAAAIIGCVEALEESRTVLRRLRAINSWGPLVDPRELDNWWDEWGNPDTHSDEVLADIRAALAALEEE